MQKKLRNLRNTTNPAHEQTKNLFTLITNKNGFQIQNFNTQIQKKAHQTQTKGSNVNHQYHIQFTNSLFIHQ